MMPVQSLSIAIIGNEDQVALMRLVGIKKCQVIEDDHDISENVREALNKFASDPSIGIIVIPERYVGYVNDLLSQIREKKGITPVIVEIPSKLEAGRKDVRNYYKSYTKKLLGFTVEI